MSWLKQQIRSRARAVQATIRSMGRGIRQDIWSGVRMMVVILAPLFIAGLLACKLDASFLVLGALFTGLVAPNGTYGRRARVLALGACFEASACFLGTLLGSQPLLALGMVVIWTFSAGMLTAFGKVGATFSYIATVCFVIPLATPAGLEQAWLRCTILLAGALWAMVVTLWNWPFRRFQPLHQAVGMYYQTLWTQVHLLRLSLEAHVAGEVCATNDLWESRMRVQTARKEAHQILAEHARSFSLTVHRLALLLSKADALFEVQTMLAVSVRNSSFQGTLAPVLASLVQTLAVVEQMLVRQASALRRGTSPARSRECVKMLHEVQEKLAVCTFPLEKDADLLVIAHLQYLVHLFKQLVMLCQESQKVTENATSELPTVQTEQRTSLRMGLVDAWRTLASHLRTRSRIVRYALRLSIMVSLATALSLLLNIPHGYWMPMSVVILLKPDVHTTRQRLWQRLSGTIAGGLLGGALSVVLNTQGLLLGLLALCCFLAFVARRHHYGVSACFLTTFLVLSIDLGHHGDWMVALVRVVSNVVGAILVSAAVVLLWPQWEQEQLADHLSHTVGAVRQLFRTVMGRYLAHTPTIADVSHARQQALRHCLRSTVLLERLARDPQSKQDEVARSVTQLAHLRRLWETLTALSMSSADKVRPGPLPGLSALVEHLEQVLQKSEEPPSKPHGAIHLHPLDEHLSTVQNALRVVAKKCCDLASSSGPAARQESLLGMYTPLSIHLPSLTVQINALEATADTSDPSTSCHV